VVAQLVTPEALVDLFEDGWPQRATGRENAASVPVHFDVSSLKQVWKTFILSESDGFRSVTIPVPADQPKDKQFRLTMRLRGMTWCLSGLDLPVALREELIKRAAVATR
jgi:hypothetical protein